MAGNWGSILENGLPIELPKTVTGLFYFYESMRADTVAWTVCACVGGHRHSPTGTLLPALVRGREAGGVGGSGRGHRRAAEEPPKSRWGRS